MNLFDYQTLMNYFPPVNSKIENPYEEADKSYTIYKSISPLKMPEKNLFYSVQIINDLRTLRILLNSSLTNERFMYELNKLYEAWGPNGRNILNANYLQTYLDIRNREMAREYARQQEIINEAQKITTDYQLKQLEKEMADINFKPKRYSMKDLDLNILDINNSKQISKSIRKKPSRKSKK